MTVGVEGFPAPPIVDRLGVGKPTPEGLAFGVGAPNDGLGNLGFGVMAFSMDGDEEVLEGVTGVLERTIGFVGDE